MSQRQYSICRWCGREFPGDNFLRVCGEKCQSEWRKENPGLEEVLRRNAKREGKFALIFGAIAIAAYGVIQLFKFTIGMNAFMEIFLSVLFVLFPGGCAGIIIQQWFRSHFSKL